MAAQDESLRLVAEVVDKFSTPLRNLRTMLQGVQNPAAVEKMKAGFEGTQKAATALGREVNNTLTPALNAAGIAGLSISGGLLAAGAALRAFTGSTAGLALIGRETGMLVQNMRVLEEVGKRFDIAPEAMQQSFRTFAENAQQLRKGIGDVTGFLTSQSPAVAKWAADLRRDLNNGLNPDEAYKRALEFMRRIEDPIDRSRFAEKLFGSRQFGLLGSEDLGRIFADVERQLGKLPKNAAESALAFKRAWDDVTSSLIGLRDTVGMTVLPMFRDLLDTTSKWLSDPAVKNGLATAFNDLQEALRKFDWKQFRSEMADFFGVVVSEGKGAIETVKLFAQVFNALGEGRILDAIKLLDSKPVLPPGALGKPRTEADTRAQALEARRDQIQRLLTVFDANPANRRDPDGSAQRDRLVKELESLTEEIKQLRRQGEDAKVQQQSFRGSGVGGGLIQNAAFGAMVASGGAARGLSSPWGGGGRFPSLLGGGSQGMRRTREALVGDAGSPGYVGGKFAGTGDHTLDAIIAAEGTAKGGRDPFNTVLGYGKYGTPSKPLTEMTLREAYAFGREVRRRHGSSSALGAFQIVGQTMKDVGMPDTGLTWDDKFTPENQMRMAQAIRRRQGLGAWEGFKNHPDQLAKARRGGRYALPTASRADGSGFDSEVRNRQGGGGPGFSLPPLGSADDLLRKALRSPLMGGQTVDVQGGANLDITLKGFPPGTSTSGSSEGILKDLNVRRQTAIPKAGIDI